MSVCQVLRHTAHAVQLSRHKSKPDTMRMIVCRHPQRPVWLAVSCRITPAKTSCDVEPTEKPCKFISESGLTGATTRSAGCNSVKADAIQSREGKIYPSHPAVLEYIAYSSASANISFRAHVVDELSTIVAAATLHWASRRGERMRTAHAGYCPGIMCRLVT